MGILLGFVYLICVSMGVYGQYEWQARDSFDEVRHKMDKVSADNCPIQHLGDLYLPEDSVSHLPDVKDININPVFPNRTALLHLNNMAMSRSFFWSYILQARFIRPAINDTYDPGMMYYFLSTVADVSANPHINASAIYFAPNSSYTPSYRGFFNKTMPRFAPRTFRADDFNDPIHLERISTLNTFTVQDLGAIRNDSLSSDYTSDFYRINEWYKQWLPDNVVGRHDTKTTYQVEIRYANNTNETFTFHGPPAADEFPGPVKWTRPYFDCGRSNKWLVAAVVPISDIYPRHTGFRHIEYPTRGGYQCRCQPGFRLPTIVRRPFLGEIVERATAEQYYNGFDCEKIGWIHKMPVQWEKATSDMREMYLEKFYEYRNFSVGPNSLHTSKLNIDEALKFILGVNKKNCNKFHPQDLELHGDVAFGAEDQFVNEAKMAVRLANFINPKEVYSGKRVADRPLSEDQMIGETLALVMGDTKIWAANLDHGHWTRPYFDCNGTVAKWVITYAAPFFGWDNIKVKLEFKGVVAVTMNLLQLDINQCPDKYYVPNAFKDTHKCDKKTSYCVPILGRGFETGGYKCECIQGYEYPFEDPITYFDGQLVEAEFANIVNEKPTRYDMFNCRLAGAASIQSSFTILFCMLLILKLMFR
ncbi:hypothetical protein C0J52_03750 [Blattella germanica]|nr:hypothetical protein C0J52_03750 [Blattella germanica]